MTPWRSRPVGFSGRHRAPSPPDAAPRRAAPPISHRPPDAASASACLSGRQQHGASARRQSLARRLDELETLRIITRAVIAVTPPAILYTVDQSGGELGSAIEELLHWGKRHLTEGHR